MPTTMITIINVGIPAAIIHSVLRLDPFHSPVRAPDTLATMIMEAMQRPKPITVFRLDLSEPDLAPSEAPLFLESLSHAGQETTTVPTRAIAMPAIIDTP